MYSSRRRLPVAAIAILALVIAGAVSACTGRPPTETRIPVKVVIVSMFENGAITGDTPGEMQLWVERQKLDRQFPFPMGQYELRMNDQGMLIVCTGGGITNATASIMALGTDSRFDFSKAYWIVAGIGGGDPLDVSLGTAAWSRHVVDGDLLYEIDAREMPKDWPYGLFPLGARKPNDLVNGWTVDTIDFPLNEPLAEWAFALTKDHPLQDRPSLASFRIQFAGYTNATQPPFVTMGESLASDKWWHGEKLNLWANDWVKLHAGAKYNFMVTNMEDTGTLTALRRLSRTKAVDLQRVMVVRTASNFTMPPPGQPASWSATVGQPENGLPAIEAAYQVGSIVAQTLLNGWAMYQDTIPGRR